MWITRKLILGLKSLLRHLNCKTPELLWHISVVAVLQAPDGKDSG